MPYCFGSITWASDDGGGEEEKEKEDYDDDNGEESLTRCQDAKI